MRTTRWWVIVLLVATYAAPWRGAAAPETASLTQGSLLGEGSEVSAARATLRALPRWSAAERRW